MLALDILKYFRGPVTISLKFAIAGTNLASAVEQPQGSEVASSKSICLKHMLKQVSKSTSIFNLLQAYQANQPVFPICFKHIKQIIAKLINLLQANRYASNFWRNFSKSSNFWTKVRTFGGISPKVQKKDLKMVSKKV